MSRHVLVVDDQPDNRYLMRVMLEHLGHEVVEATNGEEALAVLDQGFFDVVLMDCEMPVLNGYQATVELRRRQGGDAYTPIIALTGSTGRSDERLAREAGMDAHVSKPVEMHQLKRALDEVLAV